MFVGEFNSYLRTRTDAPPDFHVHAAMAALGYAAGSNVWVPGFMGTIYPNLWVCIVARSGMGKGVPLTFAEDLLRLAGLGDGLLPGQFSQEGLFTVISKNPTGMFILQEFSAFVRQLEREYNAGSMAWLTELFDVPNISRRTLMRKDETKEIIIQKPCISILGASSPDWFADTFKEQQLKGGFLARFMFCPNNDPGDYVDYPGPRDHAREVGLAGHLQMVAKMRGAFDTSRVRQIYNEWQRPQREALQKNCPPEFAGMRSRAGLMVWKSAMLFHMSEDPESMTLEPDDMDKAIRYVEHSQALAETFLSELPGDVDERKVYRLLDVIRRHDGRAQWGKAMMNAHLNANQMQMCVETLIQRDQVSRDYAGGGKGWLVLNDVPKNGAYRNGVAH